MSRDCCAAFPHDVMGLSAVCDCGFPDHTHYFWKDSYSPRSKAFMSSKISIENYVFHFNIYYIPYMKKCIVCNLLYRLYIDH